MRTKVTFIHQIGQLFYKNCEKLKKKISFAENEQVMSE